MADRRRPGKRRGDSEGRTSSIRARAAVDDASTSPPGDDSGGPSRSAKDDDAERALGRILSLGIPFIGVSAAVFAIGMGWLAQGILILAGTALVGTIGFFWASLRTLSGDAPLPEGASAHAFWTRAPAPERKREALRALKDLAFEHSIGKLDDADYAELAGPYRAAAKAVMREMDDGLAPRREKAEALVKAHLAKETLESVASSPDATLRSSDASARSSELAASFRLVCDRCLVSNEPDAAFCKKCGTSLVPADPEKVDASA